MSGDDDLNRLERLDRLRESGALTPEEFDQQKALILSPTATARPNHLSLIAIIFAFLALVAAIAANYWLGSTRDAGNAATPVDAAAPADGNERARLESATELDGTPAPESTNALLRFATSIDVIGLNPAYLDQRLGVPLESGSGHRIFEVGGCNVQYFGAATEIEGFTVELTQTCHLTVQGRRVGPETRFGELTRTHGRGTYFASCLSMCGNAADPVLDLRYVGSRATRNIGVVYSSSYQDAESAVVLWTQSIAGELGLNPYDPAVDPATFSCRSNPTPEVQRVAQRLRVRTVTVGLNQGSFC